MLFVVVGVVVVLVVPRVIEYTRYNCTTNTHTGRVKTVKSSTHIFGRPAIYMKRSVIVGLANHKRFDGNDFFAVSALWRRLFHSLSLLLYAFAILFFLLMQIGL